MKSSGITRNIDEVGRLVIPREIRKTLKLEHGTPMEIVINENNELTLKKISPIFELGDNVKKIAKCFYEEFEYTILICDLEKVVACAGANKKDFLNRDLSQGFGKLITKRVNKFFDKNDGIAILKDKVAYSNFATTPIIIESNCYGAVIIFCNNIYPQNEKIATKLANFIAKIIELI